MINQPIDAQWLPDGVRSRFVDHINGLRVHYLESGFETTGRKRVLLLHGFPELSYSWRNVMPRLAAAGYHVLAPDLRGYGRTTGADMAYDCKLDEYQPLNMVRDQLSFIGTLGFPSVSLLVGHDFGSAVAANAALVRPDVFQSLVMMSAPYLAPPSKQEQLKSQQAGANGLGGLDDPQLDIELGKLDPPRKHYQVYYSTREANHDMLHCEQGLSAFIRAYYHHKSADWPKNRPYALKAWNAEQLSLLPTYYIMRKEQTMAQTVAEHMPSESQIANCKWLPADELGVYAHEYRRTGFQGGLNSYRVVTSGRAAEELKLFAGRTIDVPSAFVSGAQDWGTHQKPGTFESMQSYGCSDYRGTHLVDRAGHWVQQEAPDQVNALLLDFIGSLDG